MATLSAIVSELAHALKQPNNKALRENLKLLVIQTRNELVRHSYENHGYVDKGLVQRFKVDLIDVLDGDITIPEKYTEINLGLKTIKRTKNKVPRPVRLTNNLPFDRVSSVGFNTNKVIPFVKESNARFISYLPGMCKISTYDYINDYIYIFSPQGVHFNIDKIIIESAFEHPNEVSIGNGTENAWDVEMDDNEYFISEDMIGQIKDIIYKRDLLNTVRETDEIPDRVKF